MSDGHEKTGKPAQRDTEDMMQDAHTTGGAEIMRRVETGRGGAPALSSQAAVMQSAGLTRRHPGCAHAQNALHECPLLVCLLVDRLGPETNQQKETWHAGEDPPHPLLLRFGAVGPGDATTASRARTIGTAADGAAGAPESRLGAAIVKVLAWDWRVWREEGST